MTDATQAQPNSDRKGLTAEILRTLVCYDPETGQFTRLAAPSRAAGKRAGTLAAPYRNSNGYTLISLGRRWRCRAHHLAWLYMTGEWPILDIDHINGIRSDNRWANLRAATRSQNLQNAGIRSDNTSGVKGVCFDKARQKWLAQIAVGGRRMVLGRFVSKDDAARAYSEAASRFFGDFARAAAA